MTTKQYTIPIEGIPEGWEPVAYSIIKDGDYYLFAKDKIIQKTKEHQVGMYLILQKTKPREITLVETDEESKTFSPQLINIGNDVNCPILSISSMKIWRIKDEQ